MERHKSKIKEINNRLDSIEAKIDILTDIVKTKNVKSEKDKAVDDYYHDPTKFPNIEGDITVSETNKHFE